MWFKIRFVQIGHVDLDEILITMNLLKTKQNKTLLFIVTHALKRHFSNEGTICKLSILKIWKSTHVTVVLD